MQIPYGKHIVFAALGATAVGATLISFYPGADPETISTANTPLEASQIIQTEAQPLVEAEVISSLPGVTSSVAHAASATANGLQESTQITPDLSKTSATSSSADSSQSISGELFKATREAQFELSLGPLTACFDQARAIACPIVGSIPVINDVVGRIALELGISCPTGKSQSRT